MSISSSFKSSIEVVSVKGNKTFLSPSSLQNLESQTDKLKSKKKKCLLLEILFLSLVILIIVGLSSLPVVFFYLPTVSVKTS